MSTIGGFGVNTYDDIAVYDKYVEYRVTDKTLNVANYEPIYAVRWGEPTEIAPPPPGLFTTVTGTFASPDSWRIFWSVRPVRSIPPPGVVGMMISIGFTGCHACASAVSGSHIAPVARIVDSAYKTPSMSEYILHLSWFRFDPKRPHL